MSRKIYLLALLVTAISSSAEQVLMQNGDRYNGKIVSVSTNAVVLQSEVLGTLTLSRGKVATIDFAAVATNPTPKPQPIILSGTPARMQTGMPAVAPQLRGLAAQTNLIQQIQGEFLTAASPEANAKFNQMINDLSTGKMTIADLRVQAKSAADQLRELQKEAGDEDAGTMDMYLSMLDNFLNETRSSGGPATNAPASKPKSAAIHLDE